MVDSLHFLSYLLDLDGMSQLLDSAANRTSVSLTDLTESVKSAKKMAMNVREKDTILSFNVLNQSNIIYSISDSTWRGLYNISGSFVWKI